MYAEGLIKAGMAFLVLLAGARFVSRGAKAQLTFFDYAAAIAIGSMTAALALDTEGMVWHHLWVMLVFGGLVYAASLLPEKSRPLRKMVEGEPTVVIHHGRILEHNMGRLQYNLDRLLRELREQRVFNIADVEFAVLEPGGTLSVLLKQQKNRVQYANNDITPRLEGTPTTIIIDGIVSYQNLRKNQLDEQWLIKELKKHGYNSPRDIAFAGLGADGSLYIQRKDERITRA